MYFKINLATRSYFDNRLFNRAGYTVIAVLVIVTGWNISRVSSNMGERRRLEADITSLEGRLNVKRAGVSQKDIDRQHVRIRFYNEIIKRKKMDWLRLFDHVEGATPEGISLSALSPGKAQDELKLEGRARSFAVVRQYLEKLEESEHFTNILLLSHQELVTGDKGRGVQFVISGKVRLK